MDKIINLEEMVPIVYERYKNNNNIFREVLEVIYYIRERDDYPSCSGIIENAIKAKIGIDIAELHGHFMKIEDDIEENIDFVNTENKFVLDFYFFYKCFEQIIWESYVYDGDSSELLRIVHNARNSNDEYAELRIFTLNKKWLDVKFNKDDADLMIRTLKDITTTFKGDNDE